MLGFSSSASAEAKESLIVEKKIFELETFQTFAGKTIKQIKLGWESYGELNADKSNAILITHYFTGNSHAAGKYNESDTTAGYWDHLIGPGKAIDTNQYFVLSMDTLANVAINDPHVITTGPATINPDTGKPYGLSFPVVTIRDFVNLQKALIEQLGIKKLHAVVGPSMGSMQAIDWAAAYPNMVERMVSVIGTGHLDAWTTIGLHQWAVPIKLDPNWNAGDYYGKQAPVEGLVASLKLITQNALHPDFINETNASYSPLEDAPLNDILAQHSAVKWIDQRARSRASLMDANHILYLVRACQLFVAGHDDNLEKGLSKIKAKTLFLPSAGDLLLMPRLAKTSYDVLKAQGKDTQYAELKGKYGHLDGFFAVSPHAETIREFLAK
nr:homoserine O-acetyltransferase [Alteromonas sp. a30]